MCALGHSLCIVGVVYPLLFMQGGPAFSALVYRHARLSTRYVAVDMFYVRLAGMILLRERDDISVSGMISGERDDIWTAG